ncbi:MAG: radical SAM protein [Candidatus Cloacimonetes bacterium]|nr:radical SAM protein [Candidatus Cloacimonadota bacterium]
MKISNKYSYRFLKEKLVVKQIHDKTIYVINETGKILFKFIRESKNCDDAYNKCRSYYLKKNINEKTIKTNFDKVIEFFREIALIDNSKSRKIPPKSKHNTEQDKTDKGKKIKYELYKIASKNNIPLKVQIEVETKCNYNCAFCLLNGVRETHPNLLISQEMMTNLFKQFDTLGTEQIIFSGGEPFLRKDFLEILQHTENYGFEIEIFTNGSLINEKAINIIKQIRLKHLQISFYGNEMDYNTFSGTNGYYIRVLNLLERLNANNIPFYLTIPLTKLNTSSDLLFEEISKKYKVSFNDIITNSLNGKNKNISDRISLPIDHKLIKKHIIRKRNANLNAYKGPCIGGITYAAITAKGNVCPCYQYVLPVGNIHNTSFKEIWDKSPDLTKFREVNRKGNKNKKCLTCKYNEFCKICLANNLIGTGAMDKLSEITCKLAERKYNTYHQNINNN